MVLSGQPVYRGPLIPGELRSRARRGEVIYQVCTDIGTPQRVIAVRTFVAA
jgi:hypothetical protein